MGQPRARTRGFPGRAATRKDKLAAIGLQEIADVFIAGSRAEEVTGVFAGESVEQADLILDGNDLRHAGKVTSECAVYVPLP